MNKKALSVNKLAYPFVKELINRSDEYGVNFKKGSYGENLIDAGINAKGGFISGQLITQICLGGLGKSEIKYKEYDDLNFPSIFVYTDYPTISTLGSQFAGWQIKTGKYVAMGSGPARSLSLKPKELFEKIDYKDISNIAILVLETSTEPTEDAISKIIKECEVTPEKLYLILVPTSSIAGSVQISGRIVETGLHKLSELGLDPNLVTNACGYAPIAPVHPKMAQAMGRTNDAIIYGGTAYYTVNTDDEEIKDILKEAPASASKGYGKPFIEIFKEANYDFYKIDPGLFAPAVFIVNNIKTGKSFQVGSINMEVFKKSIKLNNM